MRAMTRAIGGEDATTYPVRTTIAICRVNAVRSQKPSPKAPATSLALDPFTNAASATTTTPTRANT